jgi:SNF2 family DNA or RNA helicase
VHEVWTAFDLLVPGLLGDRRAFDTHFARPIGRATLRAASAAVTATAIERLDQLHARLLPFVLRRVKAKVSNQGPCPPDTLMTLQYTRAIAASASGSLHSIPVIRARGDSDPRGMS